MTRKLSILGALTALLFVAASGRALAHHGWTGYDSDKPQTLTGTIKSSGYENPHGFVDLDVNGTTWRVVLAPPSRMENRGLTRDMLKTGATARVMGYPHRTTAGELRAERITLGDKTVELR